LGKRGGIKKSEARQVKETKNLPSKKQKIEIKMTGG